MKVHPKDILLFHLPKFRRLNSPLQISQFDPAEFQFGSAEPDRHTFYSIFWFTSGEGVHSIDFESYEIRQHSLFLLAPGQIHFFNVVLYHFTVSPNPFFRLYCGSYPKLFFASEISATDLLISPILSSS